MQLQFLGATGTVTGSKYLLRHGDATILVDCGLFQGFKQLRLRNWEPLPVAPKTVDAVVLPPAGFTARPRRTSCARSCSPTAAICRRKRRSSPTGTVSPNTSPRCRCTPVRTPSAA